MERIMPKGNDGSLDGSPWDSFTLACKRALEEVKRGYNSTQHENDLNDVGLAYDGAYPTSQSHGLPKRPTKQQPVVTKGKGTLLTRDLADEVIPEIQHKRLISAEKEINGFYEEYLRILKLLNREDNPTALKLAVQAIFSKESSEARTILTNRYWHGTGNIPPKRDLLDFISKVKAYQLPPNLPENMQSIDKLFRDVIRGVDELANAMTLRPALTSIYEALKKNPFAPDMDALPFSLRDEYNGYSILDVIILELAKIEEEKKRLKLCFSEHMGDIEHPLNTKKYQIDFDILNADLPILKTLAQLYQKLLVQIEGAKKESELPPLKEEDVVLNRAREINSIESFELAIKDLKSKSIQLRLNKHISNLKSLRASRIAEKSTYAQSIAEEAQSAYDLWRKDIQTFLAFLDDKTTEPTFTHEGDLFPSGVIFPDASVVASLNEKIGKARAELVDWPSATNKLSAEYTLQNHQYGLDVMFAYAQERLASAYEDKTVNSLSFQKMVAQYKRFCDKNIEKLQDKFINCSSVEEVGRWELKTFFKYREEMKAKESFSWIRRSYFKKKQAYSWIDLCHHIRGDNKGPLFFGYHAGRSTRILKLLGWLDSTGDITESAPNQFKEYMQSCSYKSDKKAIAFT